MEPEVVRMRRKVKVAMQVRLLFLAEESKTSKLLVLRYFESHVSQPNLQVVHLHRDTETFKCRSALNMRFPESAAR